MKKNMFSTAQGCVRAPPGFLCVFVCVRAHAHACTCVLSANDVLQSAGAFPALQQMPADYPRCFFDKAEILSLGARRLRAFVCSAVEKFQLFVEALTGRELRRIRALRKVKVD